MSDASNSSDKRKRNRSSDDTRTRMVVVIFVLEDGSHNIHVTKFDNLTSEQIDSLRKMDGGYPENEYGEHYSKLDEQGLWYTEQDGQLVQNEMWEKVERVKDAVSEPGCYIEPEDIITFTAWC